MDARSSPQRVGDAHLADQPANFQRHSWSTAAASRFPAPIRSETGAVPADHGIGSDNCKCIIHLGKQAADASQYQSVNRDERRSPGTSPSQYIDLLPQHQNLCLKCSSRPKQVDDHPEDIARFSINRQRIGFTIGTSAPLAASHSRSVLSADQDRMRSPSKLNSAPRTASSCFMAGPMGAPVAASHRRSVLSRYGTQAHGW
jgi:hypothetical protein